MIKNTAPAGKMKRYLDTTKCGVQKRLPLILLVSICVHLPELGRKGWWGIIVQSDLVTKSSSDSFTGHAT